MISSVRNMLLSLLQTFQDLLIWIKLFGEMLNLLEIGAAVRSFFLE
jgi:hypothetical protein